MTRLPGLRRLLTAAELALERRIGALRQLDEAADTIRDEAEALRLSRSGGPERLDMRGEAATIVMRWDALCDRRRDDLGSRLAELAAQREAARVEVARALGRLTAIRRLIKNGR
jgi:hypothetical protein